MKILRSFVQAEWTERGRWAQVPAPYRVAAIDAAYGVLTRMLYRRPASCQYVLGCVELVLMVAAPIATCLWLPVLGVGGNSEGIMDGSQRRTRIQHNRLVSFSGSPATAHAMADDARERFLEIERMARQPESEQRKQLPRLYHELAPRYMNPFIVGIISSYRSHILNSRDFDGPGDEHESRWADQLTEASEELTPEQVADKLEYGLWLNVGARVRALQILKRHEAATRQLISTDLRSGKEHAVDRACATILALEWRSYTDQLVAMYMADNDPPKGIYGTLSFLRDSRLATLLLRHVEAEPEFLKRCAGLFQGPLYRKPAEPTLLEMLHSKDPELRYAAVQAVYECSDKRLAEPISKMAGDKDVRFRVAAAYLASHLPGDSFRDVRDQLLPLLEDGKDDAKFAALRCFAEQGDLVAGQIILGLLKGPAPPQQHKVTVMQAMNRLADSTFNYFIHEWGPESEGNKRAIARFENWLKEKQSREGETEPGIADEPESRGDSTDQD